MWKLFWSCRFIALDVSLDVHNVRDMQEVSTQPMVEQEIPEQPVASSSVVTVRQKVQVQY